MSVADDKYIETNVHPILEKLGESLAAVMPDDIDTFVLEWLEAGCKVPANRSAKAADLEARKKFVQEKVSTLLWQITYDCLTSRPTDVEAFLKESFRAKTGNKTPTRTITNISIQRAETMDDDDDVEEDEQFLEAAAIRKVTRRTGVSAEKMTNEEAATWKAPFYPKTETEREEIR